MSDPLSLTQSSTTLKESGNLSSVQSGNVVYGNKQHVTVEDSLCNPFFVCDEESNETTEIGRDEIAINADDLSCSMTLGVVQEVSSIKTIQPVVSSTYEKSILSSSDPSTNSVTNLTLDGGISWDRDDACLYLSKDKAFRFRFIESDGIRNSRLCLEALDASTGTASSSSYAPKFEFCTD